MKLGGSGGRQPGQLKSLHLTPRSSPRHGRQNVCVHALHRTELAGCLSHRPHAARCPSFRTEVGGAAAGGARVALRLKSVVGSMLLQGSRRQ
eukprot:1363809-Rhodomonas_salina.1